MDTPNRHNRAKAVLAGFALLGVVVTLATPRIAEAQASTAEWAFAPRGPMADPRVQLAIALQVDTDAAAEAGSVPLTFIDDAEITPSAEDADLLLMAAGILAPDGSSAPGLVVKRPCRAWAGDPTLEPAAEVLGAELSRVWDQYGVSVAPCDLTPDPTLADILVFTSGQPPAEADLGRARDEGGFLGVADGVSLGAPGGTGGSGVTPAANTGAETPVPADGGSLGGAETDDTAATGIGLLAALVALGLGRRLTSRRPG